MYERRIHLPLTKQGHGTNNKSATFCFRQGVWAGIVVLLGVFLIASASPTSSCEVVSIRENVTTVFPRPIESTQELTKSDDNM